MRSTSNGTATALLMEAGIAQLRERDGHIDTIPVLKCNDGKSANPARGAQTKTVFARAVLGDRALGRRRPGSFMIDRPRHSTSSHQGRCPMRCSDLARRAGRPGRGRCPTR